MAADSLRSAGSCYKLRQFYTENALKRINPYGLNTYYGRYGFGARFAFNDNPCQPRPYRRGFAFASSGGAAGSGAGSVALAAPQAQRAAPQAAEASGAASGFGSSGDGGNQVAGVDFSDTNVQIEGVDEPDVIKTDGRRVFVIQGKNFFVVRVDASGMRGTVAGKLVLPSYAREMLIEGDSVLVIASEYGDLVTKESGKPNVGVAGDASNIGIGGGAGVGIGVSARSSFIPVGTPLTTVYKVRVVEYSPRLVGTMRMEGRYISAREVSGTARIIISTKPADRVRFPRNCDSAASAIARHKATINAMKWTDWVPRYTVSGSGCSYRCTGRLPRPLTKCSNVYLPSKEFTGFTLLTVVTLPMSGPFVPGTSVSIASEGQDVFSTASTLYVTGTRYRYDFALDSLFFGASFTTSLHKFSLGRNSAKYSASGSVTGSVLNQFSMHDYRGIFFVATTEGASWWANRNLSKSKVTSFKQIGRKLSKLGEVGNLGLGERIYSVRYVADICYVVTFRQIDPLYILDLSKPSQLRVTGELKIPGFSSYLHPIDGGRIIGVGRDATPEGRTTGAKVSLFDVSDVYNPRELAVWTENRSYTNAQFDHRAFLFWKPKSLLVLPLNVYSGSVEERFSGSIVLKITPTGIVLVGRIEHPKGQYGNSPSIQRNLVLARTNLWSMSRESLQVNDIDSLDVKSFLKLD